MSSEVKNIEHVFCVRGIPVPGVDPEEFDARERTLRNARLERSGKLGRWLRCQALWSGGAIVLPHRRGQDGPEPTGRRRLNRRLLKRIIYKRIAQLLENDVTLQDNKALNALIEQQWCSATKVSRHKLLDYVREMVEGFYAASDEQLNEQLRKEVKYRNKRMAKVVLEEEGGAYEDYFSDDELVEDTGRP